MMFGTALILAGCASDAPRPDDQLAATNAAITQAESAGARDTAPRLLRHAREKLEDARRLIDEEHYAEARRVLERATADARLAGEQARTAEAHQAVDKLNKAIQELRDRMTREQS